MRFSIYTRLGSLSEPSTSFVRAFAREIKFIFYFRGKIRAESLRAGAVKKYQIYQCREMQRESLICFQCIRAYGKRARAR